MKQGDIHWVELPPPAGREQAGRRPAIIMQSEQFTNRLPTEVALADPNEEKGRREKWSAVEPNGKMVC